MHLLTLLEDDSSSIILYKVLIPRNFAFLGRFLNLSHDHLALIDRLLKARHIHRIDHIALWKILLALPNTAALDHLQGIDKGLLLRSITILIPVRVLSLSVLLLLCQLLVYPLDVLLDDLAMCSRVCWLLGSILIHCDVVPFC
jgi:hypothetical protein